MTAINNNLEFKVKTEDEFPVHCLKNKTGLEARFISGRGLIDIFHQNTMLNLFSGSEIESEPADIYLRVLNDKGIKFFSLIKNGTSWFGEGFFAVTGSWQQIRYRVDFFLAENENNWFWQVSLENEGPGNYVDLVYFQDVGLASKGGIKNSEYYTSQYIDHEIIDHEVNGKIVCSRQNLAQNNCNPFLISGCSTKAMGAFTDGSQFYGLSYKETLIPEALNTREWESCKKQHEFSAHVLQTDLIELNSAQIKKVVFFNCFQPDNPKTCRDTRLTVPVIPVFNPGKSEELPSCASLFSQAAFFPVKDLKDSEIDQFFGSNRKHEERSEGRLLSFFTDDTHVVLKAKELVCERPHGHIIRNCDSIFPDEKITSATLWMNGVFNSHLTFGNTSFGKHLGIVRSSYSILPSSGVRIVVKDGNDFFLLGMPSAFQIGLNFCTWIYQGKDSTIQVRTWCEGYGNSVLTSIAVTGGKDVELIVSINPAMGALENTVPWQISINKDTARISALEMDDDLVLAIVQGKGQIKGDEILFADGRRRHNPFVVMTTENIREFSFSLGRELPKETSFDVAQTVAESFWATLLQGRKLEKQGERFNTVLPWFLHNAMVHFATPYGLEQTSGAAWGVRDVCQGPVEMFSCLGQNQINREILRNLFSHQYIETGNWPQWYMFDKYYKIQHHECHGDIIIWPLKALCEYLENTNDFSLLEEEIPFSNLEYEFTDTKEKVAKHVDLLIQAIEKSFIPGTALVRYGGGDWNDSLQPLDHTAASTMVSSWTVALIYQTLRRYIKILQKLQQDTKKLEATVDNIKTDFNRYLIKDNITAGFARFLNGEVSLLLHPEDKITGIKYRLLPAIRGIISEIFSPEQAENHYEMIQNKLLFPDGAHLTDLPVEYQGGKCRNFQRAETAAFFGREIGTNYIHAHLRYCEAMAKLGKAEALYQGLLAAIPVDIKATVKNALYRQSNCYFSSSDADFDDRYQARESFAKFKEGSVGANGGWRIYSSGPGIFINLLLTRFLGIRRCFGNIVIDPVIPQAYNGLEYQTHFDNFRVNITYVIAGNKGRVEKIAINGQNISDYGREFNPYRLGGLFIPLDKLPEFFEEKNNRMEIMIS